MDIIINNEMGKTLVVLKGRIDTTNADQFQQDIAPLMEGEHPDIEIDCSEMTYTSSQGLRIFLLLQIVLYLRVILRTCQAHMLRVVLWLP